MNINQFNLFKGTKRCEKANLTEEDFNKNQEFLKELREAKAELDKNTKIIASKYTPNQRVLTIAYDEYMGIFIGYDALLVLGLMIMIPIIIMLVFTTTHSFIDPPLDIILTVVGLASLVLGTFGYYKVKQYKI